MVFSTIGDSDAARRVEDEIFRQGRDMKGSGFRALVFGALGLSILILVVLLLDVFVDGWSVLNGGFGDFWNGTLRSQSSDPRLGISQGLVGSFWIAMFVLVLSFPVGISAAIYLEEYAPQNWVTKSIDIAIRNLAGVPSVVYGCSGSSFS